MHAKNDHKIIRTGSQAYGYLSFADIIHRPWYTMHLAPQRLH